MSKQSSVEWLEIELQKNLLKAIRESRADLIESIFEKAKAMHREEHEKTWDDSLDNLKARGMNEMRAYTDFDNYYNETFKQ